MSKRLNVSEDTQVHMMATTLRKKDHQKNRVNVNREYSFVIKGLMVSTVLVGSLFAGGMSASADSFDRPSLSEKLEMEQETMSALEDLRGSVDTGFTIPKQQEEPSKQVSKTNQDNAMVTNLKMQTNVLKAGFKTGELNEKMFKDIMESLANIEAKLESNSNFSKQNELLDQVDITEEALNDNKILSIGVESFEKRSKSLKSIENIKSLLGESNGEKSSEPTNNTGTQQSTPDGDWNNPKKTQVVNGIEVKYGNHTYGSDNQKQYDKVMEIVNDAHNKYKDMEFGEEDAEYFEAYLDGERAQDRNIFTPTSDRDRGLVIAENVIKPLQKHGVSEETIKDSYKVARIAQNIARGKDTPRTGAPSSAYDGLVLGVADCDVYAQITSAVFDAKGYNTLILASDNHANPFVELDGEWFRVVSGEFMPVDMDRLLDVGNSIYSAPTDGYNFDSKSKKQ
ncbi:hypothetical protein FH966_02385 [Lentibacillus cibarius]|uniref:WRKY domain-containing protein n=1 Tax=Lentibacillus cibarius TaxID=2583219 RepID=A0A549YFJ4_9BACI|nr:hypothetical protein [Lentibacillus cibarius]TRM10660.1 hypothetical protein FH966_02385 [Lentibacillus cibarius]